MDYESEMRRNEPLPGSWSMKNAVSRSAEPYERESQYPEYREYPPRYEQEFDVQERGPSSYDRFNGNQPVYPTVEERQPAGRKRAIADSLNSAFYPPKVPRSHDSRPGSFGSGTGQRIGADGSVILQDESRKCISEMSQELAVLESSVATDVQYLTHTKRLLNEEINKITTNTNPDWLDVESAKFTVKILKRVLLPASRGGNNVVGRILGVGGSTLRKMCQTYKCHISISGQGSRKNPREEEDLLQSGDARYSHLACPLHAEISTTGPPHLAYTRLGQILNLLHRIITSDETFEHDGMLFEVTQRREVPSRGQQSGGFDYQEEDNYSPPRRNVRGDSDNGEFRRSPRNEPVGRGGSVVRGRGSGYLPRSRRGGYLPRGHSD